MAPSSKVHSATLKHLQLLRKDDFLTTLPLGFSNLRPPKRGAPGVPGVADVEGNDGTSSLFIPLYLFSYPEIKYRVDG